MAIENTFREIAIEKCPKQATVIDQLTESSPILSNLQMFPTSDGLFHTHEEIKSVVGASLGDLDSIIPAVSSDSDLKQTNLNLIQGIIEVGEDKANAYPGGLDAYVAKKMPSVLRKTGNDVEATLFYNNFRSYAGANSKLVDATGASNVNYTIMCVTFMEEEINGLYSPELWGDGKAFDFKWVGGRDNPSRLDSGILGYGYRMKSYFGMLMANPQFISGIVNNDITNDDISGTRTFATEIMMDEMLDQARSQSGRTAIFCRPEVKTYLQQYKSSRMEMVPVDRNLDTRIDTWSGIPIITSYNLLPGNEPDVVV